MLATLPDPNDLRIIQQFQSETAEIRYAAEPVRARLTLHLLAIFLVCLIAVSCMFTIDRVVSSSDGQIVTVEPVIVLQALDPSLITSIDVHEGDRVAAHQVLATLDPTFAAADVDALRMQIASVDAVIARTTAELARQPFTFPSTDAGGHNPYSGLQAALFVQRRLQFEAQVKADDEQVAQAAATIGRLNNDIARYQQRVAVATEIETMRAKLKASEVGSSLNLLEATDIKLEVIRNMEADGNMLIETQHQLAAARENRTAFIQQWDNQTSQELLTARNTRDNAMAQMAKAGRHNELVRLEAPQDAVVLKIAKLSVGSVLKEGDPLFNLALLDSPMQAEIHIAAQDVGFVRAGDPVTLKFDAFHFVEHGTASGKVVWISNGTFNVDESTGNTTDALGRAIPPYYKARVELDPVHLNDVPPDFRLIAGMTLAADIHVGTRSLFMYLVRGVVRGVDEAMREP
jgi:HlyD family secretion protein